MTAPDPREHAPEHAGRIVSDVVNRAVEAALDDLDRLVDSGTLTADEVRAELAYHRDIQHAWGERTGGAS